MSTKERYGTIIWQALYAASEHYSDNPFHWSSVGEVAKFGRVSRATAKKYLDVLVASEDVVSIEIGNHKGYRPYNHEERL